jgi:hypothetical protein
MLGGCLERVDFRPIGLVEISRSLNAGSIGASESLQTAFAFPNTSV